MTPSYEIVKSTKELGFICPEDRKWQEIDIPTNDSNFVKYTCKCLSDKIEVILKPSCYSEKKKKILYMGQCIRCETIYWTY